MLKRELSYSERALWLQRCCRKVLQHLGVQITSQGTAPLNGLLICNHLSYMDIVVLSSFTPCCFLSKAEVRRWPFFGLVARVAGTVFLNRGSSSALVRANDELCKRLDQGVPVALFPEGTSSDGSSVLPFHASLFEAALKSEALLTPAYVTYAVEGGSLSEDVCFWHDMTLVPHLVKLFSKPALHAYVTFGDPESGFRDRKQAAERMRSQVVALARSGVHVLAPELASRANETPDSAPLAIGHDSEADLST
jgi:1-acyl-sn-glycerol-3-phosphate acyltransferase